MKGSISKRSKDSWRIRVDLGRDAQTGKRKQLSREVRGTKSDAEREVRAILTSVDSGSYVKATRLTLGEFLKQWLRDYANHKVRPGTAQVYAHYIERHVIPALGNLPLTELRPLHLQEFYCKAIEGGRLDGDGGLSNRSVLHIHRILHKALSTALKWGLVARNAAEAADPPQPQKKEMQALDIEGVHRLLEAGKDTVYYPVLHLAVFTGLRRSELLGLRWKDIDLDMATLSVSQCLHQVAKGRIVYQEPKSESSKRDVELSPGVIAILRKHREQQEKMRLALMFNDIPVAALTPDDLVFSKPDGSPLLPATVTHAFIKIMRRAGLHGFRFHDLRHTHASLMLRLGEHPKIVSDRLGHSTIGITIDTYSHSGSGLQKAAALRFEQLLSSDKGVAA